MAKQWCRRRQAANKGAAGMITGGAWKFWKYRPYSGVMLRLMHDQPTNCGIDRLRRRKHLLVEVHDMELDRDEFQFAVFGNGDPYRLAGIFYDLFAHDNFPAASFKGQRQTRLIFT